MTPALYRLGQSRVRHRRLPSFSIEGDAWFRERDAAAAEERELVAR